MNPLISLNGTWKFSMTPPEKYWENEVDFQDWSDIRVPGECQMQGFAIQHDQSYVYKTAFEVPADDWDTKKINVKIEIQIRTQVQDVIRRLLHNYYEKRRQHIDKQDVNWQWNYRSDDFSANYLGHILHYLEGLIPTLQ